MDSADKSVFFCDVQSTFGAFIGAHIASNAQRNLRKWGIDPDQLQLSEQRGGNTRIYRLGEKLLVKVSTGIEQYGQTPLPPMAPVLQDIYSANLGFDMGDAPISLSVCPYLNTKDVSHEHVQALCHEMHTRYGLFFRDNKLENVGLADDGTPYIIDAGSLTQASNLRAGEPPFIYPQTSGYNAGSWSAQAAGHCFAWPELQREVPQFLALRAALEANLPTAGASKA